jgi:thiol-disulfide isomerase/thioredoxin
MRHFAIILFSLFILLEGCGTTRTVAEKHQTTEGTEIQAPSAPAQFNYHDQTTFLLGYFDAAGLRQPPHADWFLKGFDEYMPSSNALNSLMDISQEGLTIKIVMGTWCPDSRREVPRFMKILDLWKFPADKVTFVGVNEDKVAPVGDFSSLKIERVPTFIFYKNNSEAGRIIEVPKTSLEQDMVNILSGNE